EQAPAQHSDETETGAVAKSVRWMSSTAMKPLPIEPLGAASRSVTESTEDVPRPRLKLDPDLADGYHWTINNAPGSGPHPHPLLESLQNWLDNSEPGDCVWIEHASMSDRE